MASLNKKKLLAQRTLKIGKGRIKFVDSRLEEIKEAITKQDIKDLVDNGAIIILNEKGRKKIVRRKVRRGPGKVRKKVNTRKKDYVILTRKLRKYMVEMRKQGRLSAEEVKEIRKKIRNKEYRSLAHMKELIKTMTGGRK
jgi:large subunit ribosomal protein L19e